MAVVIEEHDLIHYGILRRSGRYPWGSGGNVPQRSRTFLDTIAKHEQEGMTQGQIAKLYGMKSIDLRALRTIAVNAWRQAQINWATRLRFDKGWSVKAISEKMEIPESTVRSYLKPGAADRSNKLFATANALRDDVNSRDIIDISKGIENHMGVTKEMKDVAVAMLVEEGYQTQYIKIPQVGVPGNFTTQKVLAKGDLTYSEIFARSQQGEIGGPARMSDDYGETWYGLSPPKSVSSDRIAINYAEDGGTDADGVIYVRPGVSDLDMRGKHFAQVRIQVDDTHYLKGMAVQKTDLPDGVDLVFNTNKSKKGTTSKLDVMKKLGDDPDNPFGAIVDQLKDENGNVVSAMNLVNEQGDWEKWRDSLASQVLSKQKPTLAKEQLNMTYERRVNEYNEIMALTNPTVRKKLLADFAESTDAAAVHLKAAALPGQRWHVILPINSLTENEIYAPNYKDGEQVALIRYPHGGTFEIPKLRVNNKNREGASIIGADTSEAVGINAKVAQLLSGADFDGDTVLVIPQERGKSLVNSKPLKELEGFDPHRAYPKYEGMKVISPIKMQQEMGDVSNLITDMTIIGAPHSEIARAVRHSMVVIDSYKHELDYRSSAIDNGIPALKEKYQGKKNAGATTLISKAESPEPVPQRIPRRARDGGPIDPVTGKKVYTYTGNTYVNKDGQIVENKTWTKKLANVDDAHTLSSGTPMEEIYADHSNRLKALANTARLEYTKTPRAQTSPSAKKVYKKEVDELNAALDIALRNAPLERQAQSYANAVIRLKKQENPSMEEELERKIRFQALETARARTGAKKQRIEITPSQWEAIQAGAVSDSKLAQILNNANMETVKTLATPRNRLLMSPAKAKRAAGMLKLGYTRADVAAQLGVSLTTLDNSLRGE